MNKLVENHTLNCTTYTVSCLGSADVEFDNPKDAARAFIEIPGSALPSVIRSRTENGKVTNYLCAGTSDHGEDGFVKFAPSDSAFNFFREFGKAYEELTDIARQRNTRLATDAASEYHEDFFDATTCPIQELDAAINAMDAMDAMTLGISGIERRGFFKGVRQDRIVVAAANGWKM